MFLITNKTGYLVGKPIYQDLDFVIWITKDKNKATKYTLDDCFEFFKECPVFIKENFTCIEVKENG